MFRAPCSHVTSSTANLRLSALARCQDTLTKIKQAILQRGTNGSVLISIIIISEWIIFYHLMNYCCWQDELDFCQMKSWWWEEHRVLCRGGIIKIVQEWFWATHYNKFWLYLLNTLHYCPQLLDISQVFWGLRTQSCPSFLWILITMITENMTCSWDLIGFTFCCVCNNICHFVIVLICIWTGTDMGAWEHVNFTALNCKDKRIWKPDALIKGSYFRGEGKCPRGENIRRHIKERSK